MPLPLCAFKLPLVRLLPPHVLKLPFVCLLPLHAFKLPVVLYASFLFLHSSYHLCTVYASFLSVHSSHPQLKSRVCYSGFCDKNAWWSVTNLFFNPEQTAESGCMPRRLRENFIKNMINLLSLMLLLREKRNYSL